MSKTHLSIGIVLLVSLLGGAGYVVYSQRPVIMNPPVTTGSTTSTTQTYTPQEVASHNSPTSCWSSIEGSVYDLTEWINRHPGGPQTIIGLCGTDGTTAFNAQHGHSRSPRAKLVLLKIGSLK